MSSQTFAMNTAIARVLRAAQDVEPAVDCADLHVDMGSGIETVPDDHWGAGCQLERCQACGSVIRMMVRKGTGFCSARCEDGPF